VTATTVGASVSLQAFANVQPISVTVNAVRALEGGPTFHLFWPSLAWTAGILLVFVSLAVRLGLGSPPRPVQDLAQAAAHDRRADVAVDGAYCATRPGTTRHETPYRRRHTDALTKILTKRLLLSFTKYGFPRHHPDPEGNHRPQPRAVA
jgi:hypothetical protein